MDQAPVTPPLVAGPLRLEPFRALRLAGTRISDPASARALACPYRDVPERLRALEERGFLVHDAEPALYVHEYTVSGITVRGLVGSRRRLRRAADSTQRALLPHEGIYPAQADDLADRMEEMALNPAPILLVQRSPVALRETPRRGPAPAPAEQNSSTAPGTCTGCGPCGTRRSSPPRRRAAAPPRPR